MTIDKMMEDIKTELTGDVLDLEISDETIAKLINKSLGEMQRYTNEFRLVEKEYKQCIDMSDVDYYAVTNIYRTKSIANVDNSEGLNDPIYLQFWTSFGLGTTYNLNQYLLNYASYSTLQQIRNTLSTDLDFTEDKPNKKLYVNVSAGNPGRVVIAYIPIYRKVDDVIDAYWIDLLYRLSLARVKVVLGRLRTAVKHSNSQITLDGDTILAEGNAELEKLREELEANNDYFFPVD